MDRKNIVIALLAVLVLAGGAFIAADSDVFSNKTTAGDVQEEVSEAGEAVGDFVKSKADEMTK